MSDISEASQERIDACVALWQGGQVSVETFLVPLVELFAEVSPEDVIALLPVELASLFRAWLRAVYDNSVPASEFRFFYSGAGDRPAAACVLAARAYFARQDVRLAAQGTVNTIP